MKASKGPSRQRLPLRLLPQESPLPSIVLRASRMISRSPKNEINFRHSARQSAYRHRRHNKSTLAFGYNSSILNYSRSFCNKAQPLNGYVVLLSIDCYSTFASFILHLTRNPGRSLCCANLNTAGKKEEKKMMMMTATIFACAALRLRLACRWSLPLTLAQTSQ